jgi:hypothetical protein
MLRGLGRMRSLRGLRVSLILNPGFQSKPWAGICERFQRCYQLRFDNIFRYHLTPFGTIGHIGIHSQEN